jgi:spermidine/putrescine ABC transporter ATP-binding subunit
MPNNQSDLLTMDVDESIKQRLESGAEGSFSPGQITLSGITKQYGDVQAVDDVSVVIEDGEFITLVGPSGCGKTTTLRTLAGFEEPTTGRIGIAGVDVTELGPNRRDVGMVFQDFALFPHLTVAENVAYGLEVDGSFDKEAIDDRVEEMLELVELPDYGDRMPDQLSGGQQQRVALARALAKKPAVLLLDEPLASLDKKLRETMQVELRRIQRDVGITTVLVTHNQKEALTMSDRIAVMNDGSFEQVGTPREVYEEPATHFVADFIGAANVFEGKVDTTANNQVVDCELMSIEVTDDEKVTDDTVSVVIRPERIELDAPSATETQESVVEGVVEVAQFMGDRVEYHLDVGNNRSITVLENAGSTQFSVGDRAVLTIYPDDCLIIPQ